jgi:5-methylcytosine-specific restriction endonuclease McrA
MFYRRQRVSPAPTPDQIYALWAEADAWACIYCGAPWEHVDHFQPRARGGAHELGNLWPACAQCNITKADRDPYEWLSSLGVKE